jgi:DNA-directed RNA polymerase alpha subunit
VFSIHYFRLKIQFIAMELVESAIKQIHFPSKDDMEKMNNNELFKVANQHASFRQVMEKFISSQKVKPVVYYPDEEGVYDVRRIGLRIRLMNVLLQNDFHYLSDLTHVRAKDLFQMKNFGKKSYKELLAVLDTYGFQLAEGKD